MQVLFIAFFERIDLTKEMLIMEKINLDSDETMDACQKDDGLYMPKRVEDYFKNKLLAWREELVKNSKEKTSLVGMLANFPITHIVNHNNSSSPQIEQVTLEKYLLNEINAALYRIENGTYGCCEKTGNPLSFECLEKWPIARYAQ